MELKTDEGFKTIERITKNSHLWGGEKANSRNPKARNVHKDKKEEKVSSKALYD